MFYLAYCKVAHTDKLLTDGVVFFCGDSLSVLYFEVYLSNTLRTEKDKLLLI